MKLPTRPKTDTPSDAPSSAPGTPTSSAAPPAAPRMPAQGHSAADDDMNIPPPPAQPDGDYLIRFKSFKIWEDENGKVKRKNDGTLKPPTIFVVIDDPSELRLLNQGKENCYGAEVGYDVRLEGNWYQEAASILAGFGAPRSTWPKDPQTGKQTMPLLGQHLEQITKGKKFKATIKATEGKGANKGKIYTNLKKIMPAPVATPAKPAPQPAPPPVEPEDDEANTVLPGDAEQPNAEGGDGIPF
jgi:hypothetical protein